MKSLFICLFTLLIATLSFGQSWNGQQSGQGYQGYQGSTENQNQTNYDANPREGGDVVVDFRNPYITVRLSKKIAKSDKAVTLLLRSQVNLTESFDIITFVPSAQGSQDLRIRLSTPQLLELQERFRFQTLVIDIRNDEGQLLAKESPKKIKYFVGGAPDLKCEHPVLIVDYHNTLDINPKCTIPAIDELTETQKLTLFVVSTVGSEVKSNLRSIGFKSTNNILVLDQGERSLGYGEDEKSIRVIRSLWASGACILGFVGDSPEKEGRAANNLNIPYFAVNQRDIETRSIIGYEEKTLPICKLQGEKSRVRKSAAEPCRSYEKDIYWPGKIRCISKDSSFFFSGPKELEWTPTYEPSCFTGETKEVVKPIVYGCEREPEVEPSLLGACPANYIKGEKQVQIPIEKIDTRPAFSIGNFEKQSAYTHDWCELKTHIQKTLEDIRVGGNQ